MITNSASTQLPVAGRPGRSLRVRHGATGPARPARLPAAVRPGLGRRLAPSRARRGAHQDPRFAGRPRDQLVRGDSRHLYRGRLCGPRPRHRALQGQRVRHPDRAVPGVPLAPGRGPARPRPRRSRGDARLQARVVQPAAAGGRHEPLPHHDPLGNARGGAGRGRRDAAVSRGRSADLPHGRQRGAPRLRRSLRNDPAGRRVQAPGAPRRPSTRSISRSCSGTSTSFRARRRQVRRAFSTGRARSSA